MIKEYIKKHWDSTFDFFLAVGQGIIVFFVVIGSGIKLFKEMKKRKRYKKESIIRLK